MPTLPDLAETGFDPDLHLPIRGKTYTVVAPTSHEQFQEIRRMVVTEGLPAVEQIDQALAILGDTAEQMFADEVPAPMILHAGRTSAGRRTWAPCTGRPHTSRDWSDSTRSATCSPRAPTVTAGPDVATDGRGDRCPST